MRNLGRTSLYARVSEEGTWAFPSNKSLSIEAIEEITGLESPSDFSEKR